MEYQLKVLLWDMNICVSYVCVMTHSKEYYFEFSGSQVFKKKE